jgi:hypothetical protein
MNRSQQGSDLGGAALAWSQKKRVRKAKRATRVDVENAVEADREKTDEPALIKGAIHRPAYDDKESSDDSEMLLDKFRLLPRNGLFLRCGICKTLYVDFFHALFVLP